MTVYKVELKHCFDTSSSVIKTYYFNNKRSVEDVNKELNNLKQKFQNYRY